LASRQPPRFDRPVVGELVENRVVVWNIEDARKLYAMGFYGKPLGIPKPKSPDFNAPLILDLLESYYLAKTGVMQIVEGHTHKQIPPERIRRRCERMYVDFSDKFFVYEKLKQMGYVVTPGIKFGCDFAVYEHGPGIDHAPYLVEVVKPAYRITAPRVVLSGRLANTVRKQFVLAIVDRKKERVSFLGFDWWRA
jgi:tRNA-intron endonuclease